MAMSTINVRNWFLTFGLDPEAHALHNGETVEEMYQRIADEINSGTRTEEDLVHSLVTTVSGLQGVDPTIGLREMFTKRGLAIDDILRLSFAGLDLTQFATIEQAMSALLNAIITESIIIDDFQLALNSMESLPPEKDPILDDPDPDEDPDDDGIPDPDEDPIEEIIIEDVDPYELAKLLFPWMPDDLIQIFADAWVKFDESVELALATVRASDIYDDYFPGIRRDDGSLRMTEAQYFATIEGYTLDLLRYNLNPELFSERFVSLIEQGVSPAEFENRLDSAFEEIVSNLDEVREYYIMVMGITDMTDEAIFASFIDPDIDFSIISRTIDIAKIGGSAAVAGFDLGITDAERLAGIGFTQQQALGFFAGAALDQPTLDTLASRFDNEDRTFELEEFIDASIFGDAFQARRRQRLLARERGAFTSGSGVVRRGGILSGLGVE